jgi:ribosome-binding factor A
MLNKEINVIMESTRQQKIERLIQKDLSSILLRYARSLRGTLISVSEVRISSDLSIAHVYLSVFPADKVQDTISAVQADTAKIRGEMGHMQRHQLRIIPELHFHLDETIDKMARIDELLKQ